jgi:hypothetical protein
MPGRSRTGCSPLRTRIDDSSYLPLANAASFRLGVSATSLFAPTAAASYYSSADIRIGHELVISAATVDESTSTNVGCPRSGYLSAEAVRQVCRRGCNARLRFGEIADPVADKLTMLAVTLTLAVQGLLPLGLAVSIVARDLTLVRGALAYHYTVGTYDMAPTPLSKLITAVEFVTLARRVPRCRGEGSS